MRPFAGFKRKAVVVLPTDKVYQERIAKRTKEEGKEVPDTAVLEMKGSSVSREAALPSPAGSISLFYSTNLRVDY